ncbi:MAG: hypothetical protein JSU59_01825, partial [Nitrospirota bacterium]
MDSIRDVLQTKSSLSISNLTSRSGLSESQGKRTGENTAWQSIVLGFIGILVFILFQACAPKPFQVKLNPNLGTEAVNEISAHQPCPKWYRLALDDKSTEFEVKTRPENCCYPGLSLDWVFPIGRTLSAYLSQAQKGQD